MKPSHSYEVRLRPAEWGDQPAIMALVRSEHLNPFDLDWRRFTVAVDAAGLAGAVQLRRHPDETRELGSLVVRPDLRGQGVAARLIDALLARASTRVLMITGERFASHYRRWGFQPIAPSCSPRSVRRNYYFGQVVGSLLSLLHARWPRRLAILERAAATARPRRASRVQELTVH